MFFLFFFWKSLMGYVGYVQPAQKKKMSQECILQAKILSYHSVTLPSCVHWVYCRAYSLWYHWALVTSWGHSRNIPLLCALFARRSSDRGLLSDDGAGFPAFFLPAGSQGPLFLIISRTLLAVGPRGGRSVTILLVWKKLFKYVKEVTDWAA